MFYLISISPDKRAGDVFCNSRLFVPIVEIESVSQDRDDLFQIMYAAFCAEVKAIKGDGFVLPEISAIGDGWSCNFDDISCNINRNGAVIEHDGHIYSCAIVEHVPVFYRLDADTWSVSDMTKHSTRIYACKEKALADMAAESCAMVETQADVCGPIVNTGESDVCVDVGYANGKWRVSPVEIL